jgi:PPOX class probable F420-dependent enzyme
MSACDSCRVAADGKSLIEPVREFLSAPRCGVLATLSADGAPRQVVLHYTLGEDHVRLNGRSDRGWVTNIRRDPRATLVIHDQTDYLHYVSIRGIARPLADGDDALAHAMVQAARYGEDPENFAGQSRVSFRLDPDSVYEYR